MRKGQAEVRPRIDVLQGTLDLMVLQTLEGMGPQHGYGIARRIEQVSDAVLKLNEGTVYAALMRLQHRRWHLRPADHYAPAETRRGCRADAGFTAASAFATCCLTAMKLSGVTEIESIPHSTRNAAKAE